MKKTYISPAAKIADLSMEEAAMLVLSNEFASEGNGVDDLDGVNDGDNLVKEKSSLWDNLW